MPRTSSQLAPVDPLWDKAIAARLRNKLEFYAFRQFMAVLLMYATATVQRVKDGELNRLDPSKIQNWNNGSVDLVDGVELDPYTVKCDGPLKGVRVSARDQSRAQVANLYALESKVLVEGLLGKAEYDLGVLLGTIANWNSASKTLTAAKKWTAAGGDPMKDIKDMLAVTGGDALFFTNDAWEAFKINAKVVSSVNFQIGGSLLSDDEASKHIADKLGVRQIIVSRAHWHNGTDYTPIISGGFVWCGRIAPPVAENVAGNSFRALDSALVCFTEKLQPPRESNRGRAGYILGGPEQGGLYMHAFADNNNEADRINFGFSRVDAVNVKSAGVVFKGLT